MKKQLGRVAVLLLALLVVIAIAPRIYAQLSSATTTNLGLSDGFQAGAFNQNGQLNTNFGTLDALFNSSKALTVTNGGTGEVGVLNCGSSATCASPSTTVSGIKMASGTIAMSSATTVGVSMLSPTFGSATSYACLVSNANGHTYTSGVEVTSSSAFTIVSGTSNSDTWIWFCIGS